MKVAAIVFVLVLCSLDTASSTITEHVHAFGNPDRPLFINKSRTIDQLTFVLTHDSHTATPIPDNALQNATMKSLDYFAIDQSRNVTLQLQDGVRALRMNAYNLTYEQTLWQYQGIYMVHGSWAMGFAAQLFLDAPIHTVFQLAVDYLAEVSQFLRDNPEEVVFLLDEGSAGAAAMGEIYTQVFDGVTGFYSVPSPDSPWPTYQDLIDRNQRLVIFMADPSAPSEDYSFLNRMWFSKSEGQGSIMQSPYSYYTPSDVKFLPNETGQHGYAGDGDIGASLYLFNHFFYTDGIPIWQQKYGPIIIDIIKLFSSDLDFGDSTKSSWAVGTQLRDDVYTAWGSTGANRRPNFIAVDFYQGVDGTDSIIFDLVNEMNQK